MKWCGEVSMFMSASFQTGIDGGKYGLTGSSNLLCLPLFVSFVLASKTVY